VEKRGLIGGKVQYFWYFEYQAIKLIISNVESIKMICVQQSITFGRCLESGIHLAATSVTVRHFLKHVHNGLGVFLTTSLSVMFQYEHCL